MSSVDTDITGIVGRVTLLACWFGAQFLLHYTLHCSYIKKKNFIYSTLMKTIFIIIIDFAHVLVQKITVGQYKGFNALTIYLCFLQSKQ